MAEECTHDCSSCGAACSSRQEAQDMTEKLNPYSSVKKVIGVVSGKGGVGKSTVTSLMAVMFSRRGYHTAILDADITGPSIPKAFGIHEKAMGWGDVFLMIAAGLYLGIQGALVALAVALVTGSIGGLTQKHFSGSSKFAFGPYLSIGMS